jgi:hypothetical protein
LKKFACDPTRRSITTSDGTEIPAVYRLDDKARARAILMRVLSSIL